MARAPKLVSELLQDIKLKMFWPSTGAPFTDAEILRFAQQRLEEDLYPTIASVKEHCLTSVMDINLVDGSTHDEPNGYSVPVESMAQVESVHYLDPDGEEHALEEYGEREWQKYEGENYHRSVPVGFAFRGGTVQVFPHPQSVQTGDRIRIRYVARPLAMAPASVSVLYRTLTKNAGYTGTLVQLTVDSAIGGTIWDDGGDTLYDHQVLSAAAPHVPIEYYETATDTGIVSGSLLSITATDHWSRGDTTKNPSRARKGDLLVGNYETPVVQLPHEAYPALVSGTCADLASARSDASAAQLHGSQFRTALDGLPMKLAPRAIAQPRTYVNHQSPTRLRISGRRGRRWR